MLAAPPMSADKCEAAGVAAHCKAGTSSKVARKEAVTVQCGGAFKFRELGLLVEEVLPSRESERRANVGSGEELRSRTGREVGAGRT